jgi:hypothetical protein
MQDMINHPSMKKAYFFSPREKARMRGYRIIPAQQGTPGAPRNRV